MYEAHRLASMIPEMTPEQYASLVEDIGENGLREPITLYEGAILDGRHRQRAVEDLAERGVTVDPQYREFEGDAGAAFRYVVSLNLHRRHLEFSQRAALAALYKRSLQESGAVKHGGDRTKQGVKFDALTGEAREVAAKKFDVSAGVVTEAEQVYEAAPDLFEQMVDGGIELQDAKREVKRRKKQAKIEEKIAELPPEKTDRYEIIQCRIQDYREHIEAGSIDAIITDPPYPQEYLHLFGDLGEFAAHALKPGGSLFCMSGQSYLPDVFGLLLPHLRYHWTIAYMTPGVSTRLWQRQVTTQWKPVLWFTKGDSPEMEWQGDVVKSDANDKEHHDWGQSESGIGAIILKYTVPGSLVCDPFMGGGTTAVCALKLDRRVVGCDCEADAVAITLARIKEII